MKKLRLILIDIGALKWRSVEHFFHTFFIRFCDATLCMRSKRRDLGYHWTVLSCIWTTPRHTQPRRLGKRLASSDLKCCRIPPTHRTWRPLILPSFRPSSPSSKVRGFLHFKSCVQPRRPLWRPFIRTGTHRCLGDGCIGTRGVSRTVATISRSDEARLNVISWRDVTILSGRRSDDVVDLRRGTVGAFTRQCVTWV